LLEEEIKLDISERIKMLPTTDVYSQLNFSLSIITYESPNSERVISIM